MQRKLILIVGLLVLSLLVVSCTQGETLAGEAIKRGCFDVDNDGYGRRGESIISCPGSTKVFDCNDDNININPSSTELCDGVDNDCDGTIDIRDGNELCDCVCNDSDGGRNPLIGGFTTFSGGILTRDMCLENSLQEAVCYRAPHGMYQKGRADTINCSAVRLGSACIDPDGWGPVPAYCS